jgi:CRP/FNR family transcriptional regulator, cyclic AMP receptor protein
MNAFRRDQVATFERRQPGIALGGRLRGDILELMLLPRLGSMGGSRPGPQRYPMSGRMPSWVSIPHLPSAQPVSGERHLSAARLSGSYPNRIGGMRLFSQDTKVQALKGVPLFAGLSRKELVQLERICEDLQVEPGKVLCEEGQIGHEFFVLVDGKVQVTRKGKRVATLGGGDFVGEIALITEIPRTATVTAESPVRFFVLTGREFHAVLDQNPNVERKVLRALARRLAEASSDPTLA